jgi:hypothetical protein
MLSPLCQTISIHKLLQQFIRHSKLRVNDKSGKSAAGLRISTSQTWPKKGKVNVGLPYFSLLPFSYAFPIKEIVCDLSAHLGIVWFSLTKF